MTDKLLLTGIAGSGLAAICCFTPALPLVLNAVGLSGLLAVVYNDLILLPLLAFFLILTGAALWRRHKRRSS